MPIDLYQVTRRTSKRDCKPSEAAIRDTVWPSRYLEKDCLDRLRLLRQNMNIKMSSPTVLCRVEDYNIEY